MDSAGFGWDTINSGVAQPMPKMSRTGAIELANILAADARLYEPRQLPANTDFSKEDLMGLQSQVREHLRSGV